MPARTENELSRIPAAATECRELAHELAPVLAELAELATPREADAPAELPAARRYGIIRGAAGAPIEDVVAEILAAAASAPPGLSHRAAAHAAAGWAAQRVERREAWLAQLIHDLKNALNTVINAVWLVRGRLAEREDLDNLLQMIERATNRLETGLGEVRRLEERSIAGPPPKKGGAAR
jgi:hypothetical protein